MAGLILKHEILGLDVAVDDVIVLQVLDDLEALGCEVFDQVHVHAQVVLLESKQVNAVD